VGVPLLPVLRPSPIGFEALHGKVLAFDASIELYQFLALLRGPGGEPLHDREGRVTSHLNGLLMKATRLVGEAGIKPLYVFDGPPHPLKRRRLQERRAAREKAEAQRAAALERGDLQEAFAKAVGGTRLTRSMVEDAQRLLDLLGLPWMRAPHDAEAQCAWLCAQGHAWAAASKDFDTLLYGAPRLVRFLSFQGKEWLPSQGKFRDVHPEVLELEEQLRHLGLTREQVVEAALLVGTDVTEGVRGYGPKKAVAALAKWGTLANAPAPVREALGPWEEARDHFLQPPHDEAPLPASRRPDVGGVVRFLAEERDFREQRVRDALERMVRPTVRRLDEFGG
jgi:flap endonuclease-1